MKNKIGDLRNHLFEVIERLKDEDDPMEIDRALAVAEVAKVVVDTAKVEVAAMRHMDISPSGFFAQEKGVISLNKQIAAAE